MEGFFLVELLGVGKPILNVRVSLCHGLGPGLYLREGGELSASMHACISSLLSTVDVIVQ